MSSSDDKKQGKFIKHNNPLLDKVSIRPFSFEEIARSPIAYPDNPDGNLYLRRIHDEEEFDTAIKPPERFEQSLDDEHLPLLKPINFTDDWLREKTRMKRRGGSSLDDEELDFEDDEDFDEFDQKLSQQEEEFRRRINDKKAPPTQLAELSDLPGASSATGKGGGRGQSEGENAPTTSAEQTPADPMAADRMPAEQLQRQAESISHLAPTEQAVDSPADEQQRVRSSEEPSRDEHSAREQPAGEQFSGESGVNPEHPRGGGERRRPHEVMADIERERAALQQEADQLFEQAKQKGYETGMNEAAEELSAHLSEELNKAYGKATQEVADMLAMLKSQHLQQVESMQHSLVEVCQALSESLLRRELQLDPSLLEGLVKEAVEASEGSGEVRVFVGSESFELLREQGAEELKDWLVEDASLSQGDFRIEKGQSAVSYDLKQMIEERLADLPLASAVEDAG